MKKTISIQISGILFHIDDDAYATLDAYLKSIHSHFKRTADGDEIVSDIENRIAEQFSEKLKKNKQVITLHDVKTLITNMGTIEDFESFSEEEPVKEQSFKTPGSRGRLYRDADDQIIGGVCSGIAKYFSIDPVIVRLAFGLSLFLGGFGVLLYILLWIILPEARTTAEKVEMTGGKVTLSAIQDRIDAALPKDRRKGIFRKIIAVPVLIITAIIQIIKKIVTVFFPFIGRILGFFIIVGATIGIVAITFILLVLVINPSSPYIGFPLFATIGAATYMLIIFSTYFVMLMPLIILIVLASSLMMLRRLFSGSSIIALTVLWLCAVLASGVTLFTNMPRIEAAVEKYHSEHFAMVKTPVDLKDFDAIELGGITHLELQYGKEFKVELEASQDDQKYLTLSNDQKTLRLDREHHSTQCMFFCSSYGETLHVTMPLLRSLELGGIASANVTGFNQKDMTIQSSGNSNIVGDLIVQNLQLELDGVSQAHFTGSGNMLRLELNGNSSFDGSDFVAQTIEATLSGVSRASVDARAALKGETSGNSELLYKSEPPIFEVNTSGVSDARAFDDANDYRDRDWR